MGKRGDGRWKEERIVLLVMGLREVRGKEGENRGGKNGEVEEGKEREGKMEGINRG